MTALADELFGLGLGWRRALELAWESYRTVCDPVGAVLVDRSGHIRGVGRNRVHDVGARDRDLSAAAIAHAELNALSEVPFGGGADLALLSTVEPCPMCIGAMALTRLGRLSFAAPDPAFGFRRSGDLVGLVSPAEVEGPHGSAFGIACGALRMEHLRRTGRPGFAWVIESYTLAHPVIDTAARRLLTNGRLQEAATARAPLDDVIDILGAAVEAV